MVWLSGEPRRAMAVGAGVAFNLVVERAHPSPVHLFSHTPRATNNNTNNTVCARLLRHPHPLPIAPPSPSFHLPPITTPAPSPCMRASPSGRHTLPRDNLPRTTRHHGHRPAHARYHHHDHTHTPRVAPQGARGAWATCDAHVADLVRTNRG
jgi:hypothetical protein